MNALKRLAASTMLGLALVTGAAQTAAAQTYDCYYDHTDVYTDGRGNYYFVDHYYCYPS